MKPVIDYFSGHAALYKKYRPVYPDALYQLLLQHCASTEHCWDCGTGNGQVASVLANSFTNVSATDISKNQLKNAIQKENIHYSTQRAEHTTFLDNSFDLITVAQAAHWFDHDAFNQEVQRVSKNQGIIALWGYELLHISEVIDQHILRFYREIVGPYWSKERKFIDEQYTTIPFPFKEIPVQQPLAIYAHWTLSQLEGYFTSWSSVQAYIQKHNGRNPVPSLIQSISEHWGSNPTRMVTFPIFIRLGQILK